MATTEKEAVEALRADVERLRTDLTAITETLKTVAGAESTAIYERARRTAEQLRGEGDRVVSLAAHQVEERPLTTVVAAFVVGLLLGMLFGRRG